MGLFRLFLAFPDGIFHDISLGKLIEAITGHYLKSRYPIELPWLWVGRHDHLSCDIPDSKLHQIATAHSGMGKMMKNEDDNELWKLGVGLRTFKNLKLLELLCICKQTWGHSSRCRFLPHTTIQTCEHIGQKSLPGLSLFGPKPLPFACESSTPCILPHWPSGLAMSHRRPIEAQ